MATKSHFSIIGAGPVGLSAALLLQQEGFPVTVYEKRPDPRKRQERGRSINLALSDRGFRTLGLVGLEEHIKETASIPMQGRMVHPETGPAHLQPYSKEGKTIFSVSRSVLNDLLLDEAEKRNIPLHFEQALSHLDFEGQYFSFGDTKMPYDSLLGCDGAFSVVRKAFKEFPHFHHQETKLDYAYKELTIQAQQGTFALEKNALHIWPRKQFMLIALPNLDGSFTCTLFLKETGENSFASLQEAAHARTFFEEHFSDALSLMHQFDEEWAHYPISSLFMETCSPWNVAHNTLLLGDAAHAIVPFYGQGLNAGLEDVRLFLEYLQQGNAPSTAMDLFQSSRQKDTEAIGQLALQNFIEMRDLVTDATFRTKGKMETTLKKWYPDRWQTQYEMVTFSHLPYSVALAKGKDNQRKLDIILENEVLTENLAHDTMTEQDLYLLSLIVL